MKTFDLRREQITIEELLRVASADTVLILNRNGDEFVLEALDAFEREVAELGRSEKFMAFLTERSNELGRTALEDIEHCLAVEEHPPDGSTDGAELTKR